MRPTAIAVAGNEPGWEQGRSRLFAVALFSLVFLTSPALAEAKYEKLLALLDAGRYDDARAFGERVATSERAREFNAQFLEALIDKRERRFAKAAARMQNLLDRDPSQSQLRFELAHVCFLMGDDDRARYHFEYLKETVGKPYLIAVYDRFLAAIRARRPWSLNASLGFAPSTNINDGTLGQTVNIGGVPFVSSNAAKSGVGLSWQVSGSYRFNPDPDWAFRLGGSLAGENYATSRFDQLTLHAFAQLEHGFRKWEMAAGLATERVMSGRKGYSSGLGPYVEFRRFLGRKGWLSGRVEWMARTYDAIPAYDGSEGVAALSYRHIFSPRLAAELEGRFTAVDTRRDFTSYRGARSTVSADYFVNANYLLHGSASYELREYRGNFPLTGKPRRDDRLSASAGVTFRGLSFKGYVPRVDYTYEMVRSNVDLFDRSTHGFKLSITKRY